MKLGKAELRLPVAHGARLVALRILDEAADAGARLTGPSRDEEALHDFRVAVRRLRSWLRAFERELGRSVRDRDRKALRRIARATNPGRDLEVQLLWLAGAARGRLAGRRRRQGAAWMTAHLAATRADADGGLDAVVRAEFPRVREALEERLSTYAQTVRTRATRPTPTLAEAIAARLGDHGDALAAALDGVHSIADEEPAHEARIVAKRLRYLVEPAAPHVKDGHKLLGRLKRLQDALGTLHDTHVMAHEIRAVMEPAAAAEARRLSAKVLGPAAMADDDDDEGDEGDGAHEPVPPAPRAAVLALAGHLRGDMERAFKAVRREWLDGRHERFRGELAALADRLRAGPGA